MDRRDVAIVGVVALVTGVCWAASIRYDTAQREIRSYAEGQRWAERNQPDPDECETEMLRIAGPQVIGAAWLAGCVAPPPP